MKERTMDLVLAGELSVALVVVVESALTRNWIVLAYTLVFIILAVICLTGSAPYTPGATPDSLPKRNRPGTSQDRS